MSRINDWCAGWASHLLGMLRIIAVFLFMEHGSMKLFGFPAPMGNISLFSLMGFAGTLEVFGGFLILIGLFTRPVAFLLSGEMAFAYFMAHAPHGFWPVLNHGEAAAFRWGNKQALPRSRLTRISPDAVRPLTCKPGSSPPKVLRLVQALPVKGPRGGVPERDRSKDAGRSAPRVGWNSKCENHCPSRPNPQGRVRACHCRCGVEGPAQRHKLCRHHAGQDSPLRDFRRP